MRPDNATESSSPLWDNVFVRLATYYLGMLGLFIGLGILFPSIIGYMDLERLRVVTSTQDLLGIGSGEAGSPIGSLYSTKALIRFERIIPVLVSMFGALALALPVAWIYAWTCPGHKTRQGVARALVVLPLAIAFVVFLVKGSLPLAFSLAGIVAAVRFRTSLNDTTDAVFLFVVIGIGLSAGVQLLSVAFLASVLFSTTALAVWGLRFAEDPLRLEGVRLLRANPTVVRPSAKAKKPKKGKGTDVTFPETVFLLHSSDLEQAERLAGGVFGRYAKEWAFAETSDEGEGIRVMEFRVRLKKWADPATVADVIHETGGSVIERVEFLGGVPHQDHPTDSPEV